MERRVRWKPHARCEAGEKTESGADAPLRSYLSLFGQIPKFDKLIATIRSREISASIILQSQSQLKTIYKDAAETILGNCVRPEVASAIKIGDVVLTGYRL